MEVPIVRHRCLRRHGNDRQRLDGTGEWLTEEIVGRPNMMKAYNRVVSNKGAAGVDCMTTGQLKGCL
jgi:RNA-directed DNA polymerase